MGEANSAQPREGAIVFIAMKNFMTFKNVELTPSPGFNMILGPNGAGKSTIVSAICLCLGGDIGTLRRQRNLSEFINTDTNAEKAEIRLKLHRKSEGGGKSHYDVLCKLHKDGRATFELDGRVAQKSEVVGLAAKLKIQTNNLCQFLPQDVVREFPSMSPEKMFESTVQAAGEKSLLKEHNELRNRQNECKKLQASIQQKKNTLQDLTRKAEEAEVVCRAATERKELEKRIDLFRKQERYLHADILKKELRAMRKELKDSEDTVREAEAEEKQSRSFVDSYKSRTVSLTKLMEKESSVIKAMAGKLKGHPVGHYDEKLKSLAMELESLELERGTNREKVREWEGKLEGLRAQHKDLETLNLSSGLAKEKDALREAVVEMGRLESDLSKLGREQHQISFNMGNLQAKERHLSSMKENRLKQLRQNNLDAYEGVQWLRGHHKENDGAIRFHKEVHEPIATTISLKDEKYAVYVERLTGKMELEAFLCEDPRDATTLMNTLRDTKKLKRINVVHGQPESMKPPEVRLRNLDRFVSEMFDCPPAVKAYLCRKKNLHRIPVFVGSCDHKEVERQFTTYFVDKQMYTCSKGRYSGQTRTKIQDCSHDTSRHLVATAIDNEELLAVTKEIEQVQSQRNETSRKMKDLQEKIAEDKSKKGQIEEKIAKVNQQIVEMNRIAREIKSTEDAICHSKENEKRDRENKAKRKEKLTNDRKISALQHVEDVLDFQKFAKANLEACVEVQKLKACASYLEAKNQQNIRSFDEAKTILESVRKEHSKREEKNKKLIDDFSKLYNQLAWATHGKMEKPPDIARAIAAECPDNLAQVRAKLRLLERSARGERTYTAAEVSQAEQALARKEKFEVELRGLENNLTEKLRAAEDVERSTLQRVNRLIDAVDHKFSELMAAMGNVGSIKLQRGEDVLDFKSYGLNIMVKFSGHRGDMQKLASNVQSGGEKSVATALYMMALQELSVVPFALLDEINQGMDDENERKVWQMLLQTASRSGAQYFYLAPKFPKHLEFSDEMTLLFCYKGSIIKRSSHQKTKK